MKKGTMKSEKEKMLLGEDYNCNDEEIVRDRDHTRKLLYDYNFSNPNEKEKRQKILKQLIITKDSFHIEPPFYCNYGYNIEVGENFYANFGFTVLDVVKVRIGDNALIGPNVQMYTVTHSVDPIERLTGKEFAKPILIGNNVWIGGGAIICPGVKIGNNVTIGAGSVVTKDIPDNVIAVGNPCRVLRGV